MIRLLRPVGPLAPHVYWLRRIMVLAVAALVVFAATKVVGAILPDDEPRTSNTAASGEGPAEKPRPARTLTPRGDAGPGGGSGAASGAGGEAGANGTPGGEGADSDAPDGEGADAGKSGPAATDGDPTTGDSANGEESSSEGSNAAGSGSKSDQSTSSGSDTAPVADESATERARSLPICATGDLSVEAVVDVTEVEAGDGLKLTARLTNRADSPCRVEVSPIGLQLQVVSGSDRVWTSAHCPVLVPTGPLTLEPDEPRPLSVNWPGTRSGPECAEDQPPAEPGNYAAQVTLGNLVSAPQQFRVV